MTTADHKHNFYGDPAVWAEARTLARVRHGTSGSRVVNRLLELWNAGVFGDVFGHYAPDVVELWQAARDKARAEHMDLDLLVVAWLQAFVQEEE